jgi:drug/metabolite transporter (DMT)-like permease
MSSASKAHISLFLAQVIYALNYSIAKDLMPNYISPLGLVTLRISGALLLFWSLSIFVKTELVDKTDLKKLMLLALFGVAVNQVFFIFGLNLTKPINSAIIMVSNPIAVMIFTLIVLKESITRNKIIGLILGVIGATTLLIFKSSGQFSIGSDTIIGDLMTLVNSLSWAVFVVMAKPYMQKYHTVTVMKWIFLFGFIYVFPFGIFELVNTNWSNIPAHAYWAISFVVVATTFLAYLLNTYALKALSSSVVSMYIYLQPFLATIIAVILGKDMLTPVKMLSAFFIISGVYLVSYKKTKD